MKEPNNEAEDELRELPWLLEKFRELNLKMGGKQFAELLSKLGINEKASCDLRKIFGTYSKSYKCKHCQKQFTRDYGDHRSDYCSELCRKTANSIKRNKNKNKEYTLPEIIDNCLVCGASIKNKRIGAKTCSDKCRMALNRKERKEK